MTQVDGFADKVGFIWTVADLLRGDYKAHEYGQVILPLDRAPPARLRPGADQGTPSSHARVDLEGKIENPEPILLRTAGQPFYNTSPLTFARLLDDAANIAANLRTYIAGFSPGAVEVLDKYGFETRSPAWTRPGCSTRSSPGSRTSTSPGPRSRNDAMGYIFEELLRRFSEMSNETAGEHFTPREVIRLMVNILFAGDDDALRGCRPGPDRCTTRRAEPAAC